MEVEAFLSSLAVERHVAASTQNQALAAILFLYKEVLLLELPWLTEVVRAKKPQRLPTVLSRPEIEKLLAAVGTSNAASLVVRLLYGTGMRLTEGLRLRVKDIDFDRLRITVRHGEGRKGPDYDAARQLGWPAERTRRSTAGHVCRRQSPKPSLRLAPGCDRNQVSQCGGRVGLAIVSTALNTTHPPSTANSITRPPRPIR